MRVALALLLYAPPAGGSGDVATTAPSEFDQPPERGPRSTQGTLVVGNFDEPVVVESATGARVAEVNAGPGRDVTLHLAPGAYVVRNASGEELGRATLSAGGGQVSIRGTATPPPRPVSEGPAVRPATPPVYTPPAAAAPEPTPTKKKDWRRWGSPLLSALIPGTGQFVNRETGKGLGFLFGSLGGVVTAAGVAALAPRPGEQRSFGAEAGRLGAYGVITGGLGLLYAGQIMDARRVAVGEVVQPRTTHRLRLDFVRSATVGIRAPVDSAGFYADWTLSLMGQPTPRFSIGAADLGFDFSDDFRRSSIQGGLRLEYRFYDKGPIWISAGLGSIFQGTQARAAAVPLDDEAEQPGVQSQFSALPYGQVDFRWFILSRWSLNLAPRFSLPVGTRYYSGDLSIPSLTPTLEIGSGIGWYF